jgi:hypothetical protein
MADEGEGNWKVINNGKGPPTTRDPLTLFFFFLLRDKLIYGEVVNLVRASRQALNNREGMVELEPILGQLAGKFAAAIRGEGP